MTIAVAGDPTLLTRLDELRSDDRLYCLYDRHQIGSHEANTRAANILRIVGSIAFKYFAAVFFVSLFLTALCVVKMIPLVTTLIHLLAFIFLLFVIFVLCIYWRKSFNVCTAINALVNTSRQQPLTVKDFCGHASLRQLSDGRSSPDDLPILVGLGVIAASVWVLQDVTFAKLWSFIVWYAVMLLDSLTFTVFNLVAYTQVTPASDWVVTSLQVLILATSGAHIVQRTLIAYRGYVIVAGNRFRVRHEINNFTQSLRELQFVFGAPGSTDDLDNRMVCVEIDYCERTRTPRLRTLTVRQLDAEIVQQGNAIVDEARPFQTAGGLNDNYKIAVARLLERG